MWLHLPSAFVGSVFAGTGFLLIHRELSHRRRLTAKWEIQEYAEAQWREIRKGAADSAADSSKKVIDTNNMMMNTDELTSSWNKGVASLRDLTKK
ncbi:hypothetical protein ACHAWO_001727 [Cyclotella atomus]|uniref:MICOS complex subunit MIC12 n=1 Tax=Cyclotella atomus TaxID=382360 RepID=A0ABD3NBK1_9STRA